MRGKRRDAALWATIALVLLVLAVGASTQAMRSKPVAAEPNATHAPIANDLPLVDPGFLGSRPWLQGEAEIAFYEIRLEREGRKMIAESILSPTRFDANSGLEEPTGQVKALSWRFFHEMFEGSNKAYHARSSQFMVLDHDTLRPLKRSTGGTSWEAGGCCNFQRVLPDGAFGDWFQPDEDRQGGVETFGAFQVFQAPSRLGPREDLYLPDQIPLLIRALRFDSEPRERSFWTFLMDGTMVRCRATLAAVESIASPSGPVLAERIELGYEFPEGTIPRWSLLGASRAVKETYWRRPDRNHQLLRMDTVDFAGRDMALVLIEELRADYHELNLYDRLAQHRNPLTPTGLDIERRGISRSGPPATADPVPRARLDRDFLTSSIWDDGKSEISFYEATGPLLGEAPVLVGKILTKHLFNSTVGLKTSAQDPAAVETFLWIGLYEYDVFLSIRRRRWLSSSSRRSDLGMLSASASDVSWDRQCGGTLRADAEERFTWTSSDCATQSPAASQQRLELPEGVIAAQQLPLVVRSLDLSRQDRHRLAVFIDGRVLGATAVAAGRETLETRSGPVDTEVVTLTFDQAPPANPPGAPMLWLDSSARRRTYWRSVAQNRQLVRIESDDFVMILIEELRAKHWEDDFFPSLQRVRRYP